MANTGRPVPAFDFSAPVWNNHSNLKDWRKRLGVGQTELAQAAGVAQTTVSALERGAEPFTEPSRTRIWTAIAKLRAEHLQHEAEMEQRTVDTSDPVESLQSDPTGYLFSPQPGKTPMERLRERIKQLAGRIALLERLSKIDKNRIEKLEEEKKELLGMLGWRIKKTVEDSEQGEAEQKFMDKLGAEKIPSIEEEES